MIVTYTAKQFAWICKMYLQTQAPAMLNTEDLIKIMENQHGIVTVSYGKVVEELRTLAVIMLIHGLKSMRAVGESGLRPTWNWSAHYHGKKGILDLTEREKHIG